MSGELVALLLTFMVHVVGACVLVSVLLRDSDGGWRGWWPRDDDDPQDPGPESPEPTGGDGLPLPGADPARVRLREPARLGDAYPRPARRPAREPAPAPDRETV